MNTQHIKKDVIKIIAQKGGHPSINLSAIDILSTLYNTIKHKPRQLNWNERDRVYVTEKLTPALQATLAHTGSYSKRELLNPTSQLPKGTTNPLNKAIGSATATKIDGKNHNTYCIITDSEQDGKHWQAIMQAVKLNKLILFIDKNNTHEQGYTNEIMQIEPLRQKYEAFGWKVIEIDGHNLEHIKEAIQEAKMTTTKPTAIIAHTIPGKGVKFMENNHEWHTKEITTEEEQKALQELE